MGIAKGKVENLEETDQVHYVDGISGATLTGKYLSEGIRDELAEANPITIKFIQRQLSAKAPADGAAGNEDNHHDEKGDEQQ